MRGTTRPDTWWPADSRAAALVSTLDSQMFYQHQVMRPSLVVNGRVTHPLTAGHRRSQDWDISVRDAATAATAGFSVAVPIGLLPRDAAPRVMGSDDVSRRTMDGGMWDSDALYGALWQLDRDRAVDDTRTLHLLIVNWEANTDSLERYVDGDTWTVGILQGFGTVSVAPSGDRYTYTFRTRPGVFSTVRTVRAVVFYIKDPSVDVVHHYNSLFPDLRNAVDWKQVMARVQRRFADDPEFQRRTFDALCVAGGGVITMAYGSIALATLPRRPQVLAGVSGGAWALALFFCIAGRPSSDEAVERLGGIVSDMQRRLREFDRQHEARMKHALDPLVRWHMPDARPAMSMGYDWQKYVDLLFDGKLDRCAWDAFGVHTVVNVFGVLTDGGD